MTWWTSSSGADNDEDLTSEHLANFSGAVDEDNEDALEQYESRIRVRPNPKGNRPRTKTRPEHTDAVLGIVTTVDRGRYTVLIDEELPTERCIIGTRARELRGAIVTGDRVEVVGNISGNDGTLARIVRISERETVLRRSADDSDDIERVVVANADQLLMVVAATNPEPRTRLVDRYLVAAFDAGIKPLLVITKTDLEDPAPFLANFAGLDLPVFKSQPGSPALEEIRAALIGHRTVFVGHSGVGKSTLFNALAPEAARATGRVNTVTGRGRHTSSSSVAVRIHSAEAVSSANAGKGIGWIIDTPGVRSFGLGHVTEGNILAAFGDFAAFTEKCPRGCSHLAETPECNLIAAITGNPESDAVTLSRLESLQRLLATFTQRNYDNY